VENAVSTSPRATSSYSRATRGSGARPRRRLHWKLGRRVPFAKVIEDYPNPKYTPRVSYLLGQFAQELKQYGRGPWPRYQTIVKQYPDPRPRTGPRSFKLAQCYEEAGEFNQAPRKRT